MSGGGRPAGKTPQLDTSTCDCGAAIAWAVTITGRRIPLNIPPEKRFVLSTDPPGMVQVKDTYVTHFATCPNAAEHRAAKETPTP